MEQPFDVELVSVSKRFGDVLAVDGISLGVRPGEFLTILGPSGSGKTTVLRMVGGFESPTSGEIRIKGRAVVREPPHRRDTSMVFQDYALFPHKTVGENIAFGLKMRGVPRAEQERRVRQVLELVNLPDVAARMPSQLSGGQRQRVALARSLVIRPSVLLLDEPLGALDAQIRKLMQIELKALQQRLGMTFLYVTHDQEEAMTISDRLAIMRDGRLEQVGLPREVYERPASRFVAGFLGECNMLAGAVAEAGSRGVAVRVPQVGADYLWADPSPDAAWVRAGKPVTVGVRPERIRLARERGEGPNVLAATVRHAVYTGTATRYTLQVGRETVGVLELGPQQYALGEKLWLRWDPADTMLIPDEAAAVPVEAPLAGAR